MFSWLFRRRSARPVAAPAGAPVDAPVEPLVALAAQDAPAQDAPVEQAPVEPAPEYLAPTPVAPAPAMPVIDGSGLVARALDACAADEATRIAVLAQWHEAEAARQGQAPDEAGWRAFLGELRRRRHRDVAFALAGLLDEALPDEAWPAVERAALCGPQTTPPLMLEIGLRAAARAPDLSVGPRLAVHALRLLGRSDDAAHLLAGLPESFTNEDWYLVAALHLAGAKNDHARVIDLAGRLRAVAPGRSIGFTMASIAHRQRQEFTAAEAVMQEAITALPGMMDVWPEAARVAQAMERYDLAFERWAELRLRFPQSSAGYLGAIALNQRLGQAEQAEALLAEALAAHPDDRDVRMLAARGAVETEDMAGAEQHWRAAIEAAPRNPAMHLRAALSLLGTGRQRKTRLEPTIERLAALGEAFPDHVPIVLAHLKLLRDVGRFDEAERLAESWAQRFPDHHGLNIARARIAENAGNLGLATARLEAAREHGSSVAALEAAYVRVLSVAGQHERAEHACEAALARFPNDRELLCEYSTIAMRNDNWTLALRRAEAGLAARPGDGALARIVQRARLQVVPDEDDAPSEPGEAAATASSGDDAKALMARFESLGATAAGCEFGLVQRRFGCEPLGLLRWAKIDLDGLIGALGDEFAGIGEPENTQLLIRAEGADHQEYYVEDSRLGYSTHTFVSVEDTSYDRMLKQSLRRLTFLRGKLLEDLRAGEKIFVYKLGRKFSAEADMHRLFEAVRRYGDNTLLCVTMAEGEHKVGTLRMLRPGLFVGYVGTFMGVGRAGGAGIDMPRWRAFCEEVAAWRDSTVPATEAAPSRQASVPAS